MRVHVYDTTCEGRARCRAHASYHELTAAKASFSIKRFAACDSWACAAAHYRPGPSPSLPLSFTQPSQSSQSQPSSSSAPSGQKKKKSIDRFNLPLTTCPRTADTRYFPGVKRAQVQVQVRVRVPSGLKGGAASPSPITLPMLRGRRRRRRRSGPLHTPDCSSLSPPAPRPVRACR